MHLERTYIFAGVMRWVTSSASALNDDCLYNMHEENILCLSINKTKTIYGCGIFTYARMQTPHTSAEHTIFIMRFWRWQWEECVGCVVHEKMTPELFFFVFLSDAYMSICHQASHISTFVAAISLIEFMITLSSGDRIKSVPHRRFIDRNIDFIIENHNGWTTCEERWFPFTARALGVRYSNWKTHKNRHIFQFNLL